LGKFQRLLNAAEKQIDPLDRSVLLTFESATTTPSDLQKRWPNEAPLMANPTLDNLAYLVEDRIRSARARGAESTQELMDYLARAIEIIRDDADAAPGGDINWLDS